MGNPRAPREYSAYLYSRITMKRLLVQARSNEQHFGLLYPTILRLLATHYPHLCLVEDWIGEEEALDKDAQYGAQQSSTNDVWLKNQKELLNTGALFFYCCFQNRVGYR